MSNETKITDDSKIEKQNKKTPQINSLEVYKGKECCRSSTVRSIWYLLSYVMLCMVTPLIYIALVTNNWQKTASSLVKENGLVYTQGVFYLCRKVQASWLDYTGVYCKPANNETSNFSSFKLLLLLLQSGKDF